MLLVDMEPMLVFMITLAELNPQKKCPREEPVGSQRTIRLLLIHH